MSIRTDAMWSFLSSSLVFLTESTSLQSMSSGEHLQLSASRSQTWVHYIYSIIYIYMHSIYFNIYSQYDTKKVAARDFWSTKHLKIYILWTIKVLWWTKCCVGLTKWIHSEYKHWRNAAHVFNLTRSLPGSWWKTVAVYSHLCQLLRSCLASQSVFHAQPENSPVFI